MTTSNPEQPNVGAPNEPPQTNQEDLQAPVPHSGVHFDEKPFRPDDNTSLQELHDRNKLETPEHPGALLLPQEQPNELDGTKAGRRKTIALVAGGALLAGGAIFGIQTATKDTPRQASTVTEPAPTPTAEATTVPITPENSNSKAFMRPNGERLSLDFITDADIKNGNAAFIIKEVASLYMTYGDPAVLEGFIDTKTAVNYIKFLGEVSAQLEMPKQLAENKTNVARFDTRLMASRLESELPGVAQIATSGGNEIAFGGRAIEWAKFPYDIAVDIKLANPSDENRIMTFVEANGRWLFSGYNNA